MMKSKITFTALDVLTPLCLGSSGAPKRPRRGSPCPHAPYSFFYHFLIPKLGRNQNSDPCFLWIRIRQIRPDPASLLPNTLQ